MKNILNFNIEATKEKLTPRSGVIIFGEYLKGLELEALINKSLPSTNHHSAYNSSEFIYPLLLMLHSGGRVINDIREIKLDKALQTILKIDKIPTPSAFSKYLKRLSNDKENGIKAINKVFLKRFLKSIKTKKEELILDIDASFIEAHKNTALYSYKGEPGYMPIIGHINDGFVIDVDFREGNISPSTKNYEFIKQCINKLPNNTKLDRVRIDSAGYQSDIFNYCDEHKIKFTVSGSLNISIILPLSNTIKKISIFQMLKYKNIKTENKMSKKRKIYTADFNSKLVLEVLECEQTLNEIASKYSVLPKSLRDWKKQFLENMSLAFDKSTVVKEYKEANITLQKEKDATSKKLGEVIIERDFAVGKLKSLVSSKKRNNLIDTKHSLSLNKQLKILSVSKGLHYYKPIKPFSSIDDIKLLNTIDSIYTKHPYYGVIRVKKLLNRIGIEIGAKKVRSAMKHLRIQALYPKAKTTVANKEHKKYPYLLNDFKNDNNQVIIDTPNKVWSTDITYIRLEKGFAYLAAVIDWHTKKILSWKLSNTMDTHLTTSVLREALGKYPKPDIFNTDQGSQYTAYEHINILKNNGISISMDAKGRSMLKKVC